MDLEKIEELRREYLDRENEEFQLMDEKELHYQMYFAVTHQSMLEGAKRNYSGRVSDTLKLVKERLKSIKEAIDERSV